MARCKVCGLDLGYRPIRRVCHSCMNKWGERRQIAFDQAIDEIGPLGPNTLKAIQKRVKQIEKKLKESPCDCVNGPEPGSITYCVGCGKDLPDENG